MPAVKYEAIRSTMARCKGNSLNFSFKKYCDKCNHKISKIIYVVRLENDHEKFDMMRSITFA